MTESLKNLGFLGLMADLMEEYVGSEETRLLIRRGRDMYSSDAASAYIQVVLAQARSDNNHNFNVLEIADAAFLKGWNGIDWKTWRNGRPIEEIMEGYDPLDWKNGHKRDPFEALFERNPKLLEFCERSIREPASII